MSDGKEISKLPISSGNNGIQETTPAPDSTIGPEVFEDVNKSLKKHIILIMISDDKASQVNFYVRVSDAFGHLKQVYCDKMGLNIHEAQFKFNGLPIQDEDTPEELGMIDDNVIEIFKQTSEGGM